jgi:putative FmdB family regulatory protein
MPIYEYACAGCRKKVSIFQRSVAVATALRCPECGSTELSRQISKFSFHRSMPDFDDGPGMDDLDENDPASVARWARRMGSEMGEDLPPDFEDELARMEGGDLPDDDFDDDSFA